MVVVSPRNVLCVFTRILYVPLVLFGPVESTYVCEIDPKFRRFILSLFSLSFLVKLGKYTSSVIDVTNSTKANRHEPRAG
jgi:hypothetical protein